MKISEENELKHVWVLSSVYKKQINGRDNWCTAVFHDEKSAQELMEKTENRTDIHCCYLQKIEVEGCTGK